MSGLVEFHQQLDKEIIRLDGKLIASHMIVLQIVGKVDNEIVGIVYQNKLLNSAKAQWTMIAIFVQKVRKFKKIQCVAKKDHQYSLFFLINLGYA